MQVREFTILSSTLWVQPVSQSIPTHKFVWNDNIPKNIRDEIESDDFEHFSDPLELYGKWTTTNETKEGFRISGEVKVDGGLDLYCTYLCPAYKDIRLMAISNNRLVPHGRFYDEAPEMPPVISIDGNKYDFALISSSFAEGVGGIRIKGINA